MTVFAPAKVNLALHVTGRRDDGYHLLDSLVVFAGVGDDLAFARAGETTLAVDGPRAVGVPADATNLVLRAAALMDGPPVSIRLTKRLPAAAGIGGGSSDAAAALRGLAALGHRPRGDLAALALSLGADVPVCLAGRPARMSGVGERLAPLPPLPAVWLALVNPGVPVSTRACFAALSGRFGSAMDDPPPAGWPDPAALARWLASQRNDLEPPARTLAPPVAGALAALAATQGCLLSRMSGSGATCFGLFADAAAAGAAAAAIGAAHPGWWAAAAPVLPDSPPQG
jgi:4-diphosphocytidyl-2-C-methyl-D-erythritol kinase